MSQGTSEPAAAPERFATTHWSVVLAARDRSAPQAAAALEDLCRTYWYPLYAFVRRRGYAADEAQDLTQEFFLRLLEKNYLQVVDRSKGRFRSYLLASLKHFLANQWDKARAQKRAKARVELDQDQACRIDPVLDQRLGDRPGAGPQLDHRPGQRRLDVARHGAGQDPARRRQRAGRQRPFEQ